MGAYLPGRPDGPGRRLHAAEAVDRAGGGEWAGHRAAASVAGSDGAAWLDGDAAEGFACDASITPVVFGEVNPAVLDDLVRLCVQLAGHGHGRCTPVPAGALDPAGSGDSGDPAQDPAAQDPSPPQALQVLLSTPDLSAGLSRETLERLIIGKAVALLSGPGGLAGFLRREQLGARLAGPSLPLDVGYSDNVPAAIRNAVRLRDMYCQWARRMLPLNTLACKFGCGGCMARR
jgi:hypothetical protein